MSQLLQILGPTASGKTALGIALAQEYEAEIFSCDARQFYREMEIGTAKPTAEELAAAPHHFINSLSIEDNYTVGDYEQDILAALANYFEQKELAIQLGGSGLFARVTAEGLDEFPDVPAAVREELEAELAEKGLDALQQELAEKDPQYYQEVDRQNPRRLVRALEICRATGQAYSSFRQQKRAVRPFKVIKVALDWPREQLYERIDRRVLLMLEQGLEAEAKALYPKIDLLSLKTVGYQEWWPYFEGQIDRAEVIRLIQRNSRRYAKRQMSWLRKEKDVHWVNAQLPLDEQVEAVLSYLKSL
ncbi:tRNA (adenosine(37)-N6)-dimethylallyltransferase MiaA [Saprospira grandis]|uniref:tRNA dimethylallyltransferase n=1 Tax=Saprospira grandis (strain Lewin) TaxID=984262 RepID=H6L875_SAPGL|nr:tRNA (adenosine(37)-N6)-dimethylallyltransferase MiaA [Saprospira grandis]AFC25403.1 tRNA delta(2)-isopentenylpyrophosphate transferase [Saprospira grandis str. Lewin]